MENFLALMCAVSLPLLCIPILKRLERRGSAGPALGVKVEPLNTTDNGFEATRSYVVEQLVAKHTDLPQEQRARLEANLRSIVESEWMNTVLHRALIAEVMQVEARARDLSMAEREVVHVALAKIYQRTVESGGAIRALKIVSVPSVEVDTRAGAEEEQTVTAAEHLASEKLLSLPGEIAGLIRQE